MLEKRKIENLFFCFVILCIFVCSIVKDDNILSIVTAVFGIIYTVLLGRGKHISYLFGIIGTLCASILSYQIGLFGNFILHIFYYFPMEIVGFYNWKAHLDKEKNEIIKEKLNKRDRFLCLFFCALLSFILYFIFLKFGDKSPILDSIITSLSLLGMFLSVKRYVEQWIVWIFVDFLLILMWFFVIQSGEKTLAVLISRVVYLILGIYFYRKWENSTS